MKRSSEKMFMVSEKQVGKLLRECESLVESGRNSGKLLSLSKELGEKTGEAILNRGYQEGLIVSFIDSGLAYKSVLQNIKKVKLNENERILLEACFLANCFFAEACLQLRDADDRYAANRALGLPIWQNMKKVKYNTALAKRAKEVNKSLKNPPSERCKKSLRKLEDHLLAI